MRKIIGVFGVALIVAVHIAGYMAYFVETTNPTTNIAYDGFGRELSLSPAFARIYFGQERLWVGWRWLIVDMIVFWGGLIVGAGLTILGFNNDPTPSEN